MRFLPHLLLILPLLISCKSDGKIMCTSYDLQYSVVVNGPLSKLYKTEKGKTTLVFQGRPKVKTEKDKFPIFVNLNNQFSFTIKHRISMDLYKAEFNELKKDVIDGICVVD